jgi:hypothetical protein
MVIPLPAYLPRLIDLEDDAIMPTVVNSASLGAYVSIPSKRRLSSPTTTGQHQLELGDQIEIQQAPRELPAAVHGHIL